MSWRIMLNLACVCLVPILGGIWARVRILLYFGTLLLAAGGAVIALAAFFQKKRAEPSQRLERLRATLATWE